MGSNTGNDDNLPKKIDMVLMMYKKCYLPTKTLYLLEVMIIATYSPYLHYNT